MTASELHGQVQRLLPKQASMRGFAHAVNSVLREVRRRGAWSWLLKEGAITTVAEYSTGTVSVTQGSATVTGSGTTFTAGMVGRRFRSSDGVQYTISAYVSGTQVTLSVAYAGTSGSGLAYRIYQDVYTLPTDCGTLMGWWNSQTRSWMRCITRADVYARGVLMDSRSGWIEAAAQWGVNASNVAQVLIWPVPTDVVVLPLLYTRKITAVTGPGVTLDIPPALELVVAQGVKWLMLENASQEEGGPSVERGVLDHQRNRFRSMLDDEFAEDVSQVPSEICVGAGEMVDVEDALRGGWGFGVV